MTQSVTSITSIASCDAEKKILLSKHIKFQFGKEKRGNADPSDYNFVKSCDSVKENFIFFFESIHWNFILLSKHMKFQFGKEKRGNADPSGISALHGEVIKVGERRIKLRNMQPLSLCNFQKSNFLFTWTKILLLKSDLIKKVFQWPYLENKTKSYWT